MSEIMKQLQQDHANVAFMLGVLEKQLVLVKAMEEVDFELMHDVMIYMTSYPDRIHHPLEDFMFERVVERSEQPSELVETLRREHQGLAEKGARFRDILEHVVDGSMVRRAEVEEKGDDYVAFLRHHMVLEDSEAFPLAERILKTEDWIWIGEQFEMEKDPVFGPVVEQQFESLLVYIQGVTKED